MQARQRLEKSGKRITDEEKCAKWETKKNRWEERRPPCGLGRWEKITEGRWTSASLGRWTKNENRISDEEKCAKWRNGEMGKWEEGRHGWKGSRDDGRGDGGWERETDK
jgi:hypothetical protein